MVKHSGTTGKTAPKNPAPRRGARAVKPANTRSQGDGSSSAISPIGLQPSEQAPAGKPNDHGGVVAARGAGQVPRLSRPAGAPGFSVRFFRWFRCASPPANLSRASGPKGRREMGARLAAATSGQPEAGIAHAAFRRPSPSFNGPTYTGSKCPNSSGVTPQVRCQPMNSGLKGPFHPSAEGCCLPAMDRAFSALMVTGALPGALPQAGISPRLWR